MKKRTQMSETFPLGLILALAGGFLDAYTYVCRGGVFANAETGNIVLMGLKLADGDFRSAMHYLIPIVAFACGILASEAVKRKFKLKPGAFFHWRQITVALEIAVLAVISFVPSTNANNIYTNALVAFAASIQVQSFRKISGVALTTTMCTGNLRSATEALFTGVSKKDGSALKKSGKYFSIIGFFIIGAILGAIITRMLDIKAALVAAGILAVPFALMFIDFEKDQLKKQGSGIND